jgi:hypothetical protein
MRIFDPTCEAGIEEVYNHESLDDVVEMRPTADGCYVGPDLRNNEDRSLVGLVDWQSEFAPTTSADGRILEGFVIA